MSITIHDNLTPYLLGVRTLYLEQTEKVIGQDITFDSIPWMNREKGYLVNPNTPFDPASILARPFSYDNAVYLHKGVHLHFQLPSYYKTFEKGELPSAPNRWYVKRIRSGVEDQEWVVESDYIWDENDSQLDKNEVCTFVEDDINVDYTFKYVGRKFSYEEWLKFIERKEVNEKNEPVNRLKKLTALGWGTFSFDVHYANCRSIFGFYDEDGKQGDEYIIFGCSTNSADTVFSKIKITENADIAMETDFHVSLANNIPEALITHFSNSTKTSDTLNQLQLEELLETAINYNDLSNLRLDWTTRLRSITHEENFNNVSGTTKWEIEGKVIKKDEKNELEVGEIIYNEVISLDKLNAFQSEFELQRFRLNSKIEALYLDWSNLQSKTFKESNVNLNFILDDLKIQKEQIELLEAHINKMREQLDKVLNEVKIELNNFNTEHLKYELKSVPRTNYFTVAPPAIVISADTDAAHSLLNSIYENQVINNEKSEVGVDEQVKKEKQEDITVDLLDVKIEHKVENTSFKIYEIEEIIVEDRKLTNYLCTYKFDDSFARAVLCIESYMKKELGSEENTKDNHHHYVIKVDYYRFSFGELESDKRFVHLEYLDNGTWRYFNGLAASLGDDPHNYSELFERINKEEDSDFINVDSYKDRFKGQFKDQFYEDVVVNLSKFLSNWLKGQYKPIEKLNGKILEFLPIALEETHFKELSKNANQLKDVKDVIQKVRNSNLPNINYYESSSNFQNYKLEWEASFVAQKTGNYNQSFDRNFQKEFINANYKLDDFHSELIFEEDESNANMYEQLVYGQGYVGPTLKQYLFDNLAETAEILENTKKDSTALTLIKAYKSFLKESKTLEIELSDFNNLLMQRTATMSLLPNAPNGFKEYQVFAHELSTIIKRHQNDLQLLNEVEDIHFNPFRNGLLTIKRLRLIDTFGREKEIIPQKIFHPAKGNVTLNQGNNKTPFNALRLNPRLLQASTLSARFDNTESRNPKTGIKSTNPVLGYVIPVFINQRLEFFDSFGYHIGAVDKVGKWEESPFADTSLNPTDGDTSGFEGKGISGELRTIIEWFITNINNKILSITEIIEEFQETAKHIFPEDQSNPSLLESISMIPIAITKIKINLFTKGEEYHNLQDSTIRKKYIDGELVDHIERTSNNYTGVQIPLAIGNINRFNDGLFGYWNASTVENKTLLQADSTLFYTDIEYISISNLNKANGGKTEATFLQYLTALLKDEPTKFKVNDLDNRVFQEKTIKVGDVIYKRDILNSFHDGQKIWELLCEKNSVSSRHNHVKLFLPESIDELQHVTINGERSSKIIYALMHPKSTIHFKTGVLPEKQLSIPYDKIKHALKRIELTLLTAPILTPADQLELTLLNDSRYRWSWLEINKKANRRYVSRTTRDFAIDLNRTCLKLIEEITKDLFNRLINELKKICPSYQNEDAFDMIALIALIFFFDLNKNRSSEDKNISSKYKKLFLKRLYEESLLREISWTEKQMVSLNKTEAKSNILEKIVAFYTKNLSQSIVDDIKSFNFYSIKENRSVLILKINNWEFKINEIGQITLNDQNLGLLFNHKIIPSDETVTSFFPDDSIYFIDEDSVNKHFFIDTILKSIQIGFNSKNGMRDANLHKANKFLRDLNYHFSIESLVRGVDNTSWLDVANFQDVLMILSTAKNSNYLLKINDFTKQSKNIPTLKLKEGWLSLKSTQL